MGQLLQEEKQHFTFYTGRKAMKKKTKVWMMTIVFVFGLAVAVQGVKGQEENSYEKEQYYDIVEEKFLEVLREELEEKGFYNTGITMTKVLEEDGSRKYSTEIHNKSITYLNEQEKEELKEDLMELAFSDENSSMEYEFIVFEEE